MSGNQDQYNRGGLIAFVFSMAFVFCFMIYLVGIHQGVNLDEKVVDPKAAGTADAKPQFDIAKVSEPWVPTPELVEYGAKLFKTNCAMCHGDQGKGDGPAGMGLNPRPRNLVEGQWKTGPGLINKFNVVTNGLPGTSMAAFGHFKVGDRWALAHFIQSITQNKGTDDPAKIAEFAKTAK